MQNRGDRGVDLERTSIVDGEGLLSGGELGEGGCRWEWGTTIGKA